MADLEVSQIPYKLCNELVKLAYANKERRQQELAESRARIQKLLAPTPTESDPTTFVHNLSATVTSDGKTIRVQFGSVQLDILKQDNGRFELQQKS